MPSLPAWLMLGAIREDDVPYDPGELENSPQDATFGPFIRVLHHFYDPYRDQPLTMAGAQVGRRAHDWAMRGDPNPSARDNGFTVATAREAMWRALTATHGPSKPYAEGPLMEVAFAPSAAIPTREAQRTAYWATTFRALGSVIHLVQDMAQPQHTRNDPHAGVGCELRSCAGGHKSYYEAYVEARVRKAPKFTLRERFFRDFRINDVEEAVDPVAPIYGGYAIPRHARYDDFFATGTGYASRTGKGLANYSNQGFYSSGTVIGTTNAGDYGSPPASAAGLATQTIAAGQVVDAAGRIVDRGALDLLIAPVVDANDASQSRPAVRLATVGAFDQFLNSTTLRHFTLTHYNYAAQAELLLPRAVAYSAGLIDYFFRGRLEIGLPDESVFAVRDASPASCTADCGFERVKLKLTNATPDEAMGPGVAVAVVKFHRNTCYRSDLSGEPGGPHFAGNGCRHPEEEIVVSAARVIAAQATGTTQTLAFDFTLRPIPLSATDVSLQVVFRGRLGDEDDAVAVTTRNVAEPTYLALENATDYRFSSATGAYAPSGAPVVFSDAKVKFGMAPQPVATLPTLPAPGHAQFAYLGDGASTPVWLDFTAPSLVGGHPLTATLPAFQFYLPAGTGTTYASNWPVSPVRGMQRRFVYSVARTQGYDVYLCSPDFNPSLCGETTLPPLTAAQAVPWAVAFQ